MKIYVQKTEEAMSVSKCKNCGKYPKIHLVCGKKPYLIECYCGRSIKQVDANADCIKQWNEMNL